MTPRLLGAALLLAAAGCGGSGGEQQPPPMSCFTGDATAAPEATLVYQMPGGRLAPVTDGTVVPLAIPPQGGEALIVGVRALNVDGCPLTMSTSLVVPASGVVAAFERRPVTLEPAADGWLEPKNPSGLANFSNLAACPIAGLGQDVDGQTYRLTIQVEDLAGRQAEATALMVPDCEDSPNPARCRCVCAAGYVLGHACP